MNGFLLLAILGQWYISVLYDPPDTISGLRAKPLCVFADSQDNPVAVVGVWYPSSGHEELYSFWWNNGEWLIDTLPPSSQWSYGQWRMDSLDRFWVAIGEDSVMRLFYGAGSVWDSLPVLTLPFPFPACFTMSKENVPHVFNVLPGFPECTVAIWHFDFPGDTWALERDFSPGQFHDIWKLVGEIDKTGKAHVIFYNDDDTLGYCLKDGDTWTWEVVETLDGEGDFAMSPLHLCVDREGNSHVIYAPFLYSTMNYQTRYACRDSLGWHMDTVLEYLPGLSSPCVDTSGGIHFLVETPYPCSLYRYYRFPGEPDWHEEFIRAGPAYSPFLAIDSRNYLHAVYHVELNDPSKDTLFYATTNPGLGVSESSPEPKPDLILIPANHGFYISGYSGKARIYDPAGRLILAREIKGKTLISPLRPGVYFVVAEKQRARIAVR